MNESNEYYWLGFYELGKGSIVYPGNWGRIERLALANNPYVANELVLENARLRQFPNLPSRLTSIFLCKTIEDIKDFKLKNSKITEIIHKVKLTNISANITTADWSLAMPQLNESFGQAELRALQYWKNESTVNQEVLAESAIEVMDIWK